MNKISFYEKMSNKILTAKNLFAFNGVILLRKKWFQPLLFMPSDGLEDGLKRPR